jgi:hypothetical protein
MRIDRDRLAELGQTLEASMLPGGLAHEAAEVSLEPGWGNPLRFHADIAPRLSAPIGVTFVGWDSDTRSIGSDDEDSAFYMVTVISEDFMFLRGLMLTAAYEWEDGDVSGYAVTAVTGEVV